MNIINTIFPFFLTFACIRAVFVVLSTEKIFNNNILIGLIIGIPCGAGISFLFSAGVLWIVIGILSFFGVATVGAWTVGFSWTAVKVTMMTLYLINLIRKR